MGARCSQLDGLYDHPSGTWGPGICIIMGMRIANAITRVPTSISFAKAAALGVQNKSGAKASQRPTKVLAHAGQTCPERQAIAASAMTRMPLITSLHMSGPP